MVRNPHIKYEPIQEPLGEKCWFCGNKCSANDIPHEVPIYYKWKEKTGFKTITTFEKKQMIKIACCRGCRILADKREKDYRKWLIFPTLIVSLVAYPTGWLITLFIHFRDSGGTVATVLCIAANLLISFPIFIYTYLLGYPVMAP